MLVTKDRDFAERVSLAHDAPVIVWVQAGYTTRRALLEWLDPLLDQLIPMIDAGERLIELR